MTILIKIKVIPFIAEEVARLIYISKEYKFNKLKKRGKKMQIEIRELYDDVQKELALLKKIEQHRNLHPEEKYWKEKVEKYHNIIKKLK